MEALSSSVAIIERMVDLKQVLQVEGVFHAFQQGISQSNMQYMISCHENCVVKVYFQTVKHFIRSVHLIMGPGIDRHGLQVCKFFCTHMYIYNI